MTVGNVINTGMDLRDYFAAVALVGLARNYSQEEYPDVARRCYRLADAMLKARGARP